MTHKVDMGRGFEALEIAGRLVWFSDTSRAEALATNDRHALDFFEEAQRRNVVVLDGDHYSAVARVVKAIKDEERPGLLEVRNESLTLEQFGAMAKARLEELGYWAGDPTVRADAVLVVFGDKETSASGYVAASAREVRLNVGKAVGRLLEARVRNAINTLEAGNAASA